MMREALEQIIVDPPGSCCTCCSRASALARQALALCHSHTCPTCDGRGYVLARGTVDQGAPDWPCPACSGSDDPDSLPY